MGKWIKTDGTQQEVPPEDGKEYTLQEMNGFVGGYLEALRLTNNLVMYVNEEGVRLQLPLNFKAMEVLKSYRPEHASTPIVGNVIIASLQETGDNEHAS